VDDDNEKTPISKSEKINRMIQRNHIVEIRTIMWSGDWGFGLGAML
jgi:hypothetical protein